MYDTVWFLITDEVKTALIAAVVLCKDLDF